jgi:hypothetical protein
MHNFQHKGAFQPDIRILQDSAGYTFVDSKLKDNESYTEVRLVPLPDDAGNFDTALRPEAANVEKPEEVFGESFCMLEICRVWRNGSKIFTSSIMPRDANGDEVAGRRTPTYVFMSRLRYLIRHQEELKKAGQPIQIPELWLPWVEKGVISVPYSTMLGQCMYKTVNGVIMRDAGGRVTWKFPGVFAFPRGYLPEFTKKVSMKEDMEQALALGNSVFGDFVSIERGRILRLNRMLVKNDDAKPASKDSKNKFADGQVKYFLTLLNTVLPIDMTKMSGLIKPWGEVIRVPTIEESIAYLEELYEPAAVDYAFRGSKVFYKYVSESIKGTSDLIPEPPRKEKKAEGEEAAGGEEAPTPPPPITITSPANPTTVAVATPATSSAAKPAVASTATAAKPTPSTPVTVTVTPPTSPAKPATAAVPKTGSAEVDQDKMIASLKRFAEKTQANAAAIAATAPAPAPAPEAEAGLPEIPNLE